MASRYHHEILITNQNIRLLFPRMKQQMNEFFLQECFYYRKEKESNHNFKLVDVYFSYLKIYSQDLRYLRLLPSIRGVPRYKLEQNGHDNSTLNI